MQTLINISAPRLSLLSFPHRDGFQEEGYLTGRALFMSRMAKTTNGLSQVRVQVCFAFAVSLMALSYTNKNLILPPFHECSHLPSHF
jgi:hypothetical protein